MYSIIIPAHNEGVIIGNLIERLTSEAESCEFELMVVANGCNDDTAERARSYRSDRISVRVAEIAEGSKPAALNYADQHVDSFPRLYLDADIDVSLTAVRACVERLRTGALAVAPSLTVDTTSSAWGVRAYYRVWRSMPWVRDGLIGSGFIGVSEAGRARFGPFPVEGADDLWVSASFTALERVSIQSHVFTVRASPTLRQLIRRHSRIRAANTLLLRRHPHLPGKPQSRRASSAVALRLGLRRPVDLIVFLSATAAIWARAKPMIATQDVRWHGDPRSTSTNRA